MTTKLNRSAPPRPTDLPASAPGTPTGKRTHRADIQALRALAVVVVLAYHFAPALLPGGFVGVDIFFVISGFVITSLMLTELDSSGSLSMIRFYARRARRILPAATATILATVGVGLLLLPLNRWEGLAVDAPYTAILGQNRQPAAAAVDHHAGHAAA